MFNRSYYRNMHPRVSREEYDFQVRWNHSPLNAIMREKDHSLEALADIIAETDDIMKPMEYMDISKISLGFWWDDIAVPMEMPKRTTLCAAGIANEVITNVAVLEDLGEGLLSEIDEHAELKQKIKKAWG